jgi:hypothetical protein
MAALVAAQEVSQAPPVAAEIRPPARKIYKKEKPPLAALMLLAARNWVAT